MSSDTKGVNAMMYLVQLQGYHAQLLDNKEVIEPFLNEWCKSQEGIEKLTVNWKENSAWIIGTATIQEDTKELMAIMGVDVLEGPVGAVMGIEPQSAMIEPVTIYPTKADKMVGSLETMEVVGHG